jgi:hypothetical protein
MGEFMVISWVISVGFKMISYPKKLIKIVIKKSTKWGLIYDSQVALVCLGFGSLDI